MPAIALGTNIAAGMILFSLLGYYIDSKVGGTKQFWTLGGMFLGLLYSGYEVWKVVRVMDRDNEKNENSLN